MYDDDELTDYQTLSSGRTVLKPEAAVQQLQDILDLEGTTRSKIERLKKRWESLVGEEHLEEYKPVFKYLDNLTKQHLLKELLEDEKDDQ